MYFWLNRPIFLRISAKVNADSFADADLLKSEYKCLIKAYANETYHINHFKKSLVSLKDRFGIYLNKQLKILSESGNNNDLFPAK